MMLSLSSRLQVGNAFLVQKWRKDKRKKKRKRKEKKINKMPRFNGRILPLPSSVFLWFFFSSSFISRFSLSRVT
ncbi:hypothetical protein ACKS0A_09967 [Histoplasma ohiense]